MRVVYQAAREVKAVGIVDRNRGWVLLDVRFPSQVFPVGLFLSERVRDVFQHHVPRSMIYSTVVEKRDWVRVRDGIGLGSRPRRDGFSRESKQWIVWVRRFGRSWVKYLC